MKVFAEQGFFQSTISQIAREAGVADGTIYLYFKNKDDILLQFFGYKTKQVFQSFREELDKADTARDKLRNLIRRHLEEFQNDKNMAVVYQAEARSNSRLVEKQLQEMSKMYLDITAEIIEQGQEEGQIRKDLYVSLVKRFILGAVEEVINTWVLSGGKYDLVSMAEPLVDLIFRGIGSAAATAGQASPQSTPKP
ncbi:MAG: TetR family transcriptional regulator [Desulfobacteraceae bacterium]|nr:TetR family transcriptional regulator [Desulfobacteraceae bacterium]